MAYYDFRWRPYVSAEQRRAAAARKLLELRKKGHVARPVTITGRAIASSAWGKAWCDHLESYSDYANRLPRGRTYVRNGSVIDLQIEAGRVRSMVSGTSIYEIEVTISALAAERWKAIVADTSGRIESVVGLLRGRIDGGVMARMTDRQRGLFPAPREIELSCSCPDWAGMCKHVAATLYGVGARLDAEPELLFLLRGVDHRELIAAGASALAGDATAPEAGDDATLGALFGIEIAGEEPYLAAAGPPAPATRAPSPAAKRPARRAPTTRTAKAARTARRAPAKRKPESKAAGPSRVTPATRRASSKVRSPKAKPRSTRRR